MRNEMGNQNTSGIKEEEKATVEVAEKPEEATHEDAAKGENNIVSEGDQPKDFHDKVASSDDLSVTKDSTAERHELDEKALISEQGHKESDHPPSTYLDDAKDSNNSVNQESYEDRDDSGSEATHEKELESNLEEILPTNGMIQNHDNHDIAEGKVESPNSNSELEHTFQDPKTTNEATTPLVEHQNLSFHESEEVLEVSVSCHIEEKQNDHIEIDKEGNSRDLVLDETYIPTEQSHIKVIEEKVQNVRGNDGDIQLPLEENVNVLSSPTEAVSEVGQIDPSPDSPDPEEKHFVPAEEINLISGGSENPDEEPDSGGARFSEQTIFIDTAMPGIIEQEACSKENGSEETVVEMSPSFDMEMVSEIEGTKVSHTTTEQEQFMDKGVVLTMLETRSGSYGLTSTEKYNDGEHITENLLVEEPEKRTDDSTSTKNGMQFEGENYLIPISPTSSFNHHLDNGFCPEAADQDWNNCSTVNLEQGTNSECDVLTAEVSASNAQKATIMQTVNPCASEDQVNHVQELEQETSPLPCFSKAPANSAAKATIIELSNPDYPASTGRVKLRKSPSFEFGTIALDARSEESDQTLLLIRDKSLARSFSGHANVRFQNVMIATNYGLNSSLVDYEAVTVEEKTIRMERSDSDISRDSFVSLLRRDQKPSCDLELTISEEKEALESPSQELALTQVKTSAKRRPRSSLFSSCICCTTAIS